ncbi:MAG: putative tigger transposable element-derived protein 4 [Streblomastix strix]|uniref:Putative tigger transposable element-derived protein 4 n=1 Tax=Streblomastix strix TaxID=222440 RepID=A0A5J4W655_9EUKA|nr:MAG: putative tigger transposable element-derived protein 4 [Streblomastix strix]
MNKEIVSANYAKTEQWKTNILPELIRIFGQKNLLNFDEFALYFKRGSEFTFGPKGQQQYGKKLSKSRLTAFTGASILGEKFYLLIIGKAQVPKSFRSHLSHKFKYKGQKNAWNNSIIFNWILAELNEQFIKDNRKVCITIDNCQAHAIFDEELSNITVMYLPSNTTSILQPMDSGIIASDKKRYKYLFKSKILKDVIAGKQTNIDLFQAATLLQQVWDDTNKSVIQNCFDKAWQTGKAIDQYQSEKEDDSQIEITNDEEENLQTTASLSDAEICQVVINKQNIQKGNYIQESDEDEDEKQQIEKCSSQDAFQALHSLDALCNQLRLPNEQHQKLRKQATNYFLKHPEMISFVVEHNELAEKRIGELIDG